MDSRQEFWGHLMSLGLGRSVVVVCAAALALAIAPRAQADSINIVAKGTINGACSITIGQNFQNVNLSSETSASATAVVNCNTGFVTRATSANGALVSNSTTSANYTNRLDYTLNLAVPLDGGGTVSASCGAATLAAGQGSCALSPAGGGLSSAGRIATNQTATLTANWTLPASPRLVQGRYSDTITLSITATP